LPGGPFSAVAVSGDYVYLGSYGLVIADVSDPSAPGVVGGVGLPAEVYGLAVSGGYAYVTYGEWDSRESGLRVIDVSEPSSPVEVGSIGTPGYAWGVEVWATTPTSRRGGGASGDRREHTVGPGRSRFHRHAGERLRRRGVGGYAYVADFQSGLRVIDVSTPSAPVEVGFLDTAGYASDVAVSGGYAYVADKYMGLRVIDVNTPSAPVEVGFVETPGDCNSVAVLVGHAYVADGSGGLRVIDISTPSAPVEVGFVDTGATGVAVAAGYAYVAGGGLSVVDVSTPSAPVTVGGLTMGTYATMLRCRATTRTSRAPVSA